jgi:hypothetical protein
MRKTKIFVSTPVLSDTIQNMLPNKKSDIVPPKGILGALFGKFVEGESTG